VTFITHKKLSKNMYNWDYEGNIKIAYLSSFEILENIGCFLNYFMYIILTKSAMSCKIEVFILFTDISFSR